MISKNRTVSSVIAVPNRFKKIALNILKEKICHEYFNPILALYPFGWPEAANTVQSALFWLKKSIAT
jgi:hypothetical protein